MKLKTYQAKSIADALAKVKKDLGRDAVILHTRTLTRGGVLGLGSRSIVEITATNDDRVMSFRKAAGAADAREELPSPKPTPRDSRLDAGRAAPASSVLATAMPRDGVRGLGRNVIDQAPAEAKAAPREAAPAKPVPAAAAEGELRREVSELREMVRDLIGKARTESASPDSEALVEYYTYLLSQDVEPALAGRILRSVRDRLRKIPGSRGAVDQASRDQVLIELHQSIAEVLPSASPLKLRDDGRPTLVALVGPTGVGKTTTIAKLAANMKLRENKRVGLITIDAYRIAAIEQLKTYAQILRIPIVSVLRPEQIQDAVEQLGEQDLILIDTAGRSQKDGLRIAELAEFIRASNCDQVHLVLSTTSSAKTIREAIDRFKVLGVEQVIFTKLDEATGPGVILNVLQDGVMRPSYLTTGQAVPDDIEIGSATRVAKFILNGLTADADNSGRSSNVNENERVAS